MAENSSRSINKGRPRVLVLRAPGTNCDAETVYAFEQVGACVSSIHVNRLIDDPSLGRNFQILCIPGGFSYGDDIAAGRILARRLQVHVQDLLEEFRGRDRLVLGICNGFQVMMRLGIFFPSDLYPDAAEKPPATLTLNDQARFEDRWVHLRNLDSNSPFLRDIHQMFLPMAHAEGKFVTRCPDVTDIMRGNSQLGLRYCRPTGETSDAPLPFPENPNGAEYNVAGISDPSGRIFGLMPHPERHLEWIQHPHWTRRKQQPEHGDGWQLFKNAVDYFA